MKRYLLSSIGYLLCLAPSTFCASCVIMYDSNGNMTQDALCNLYSYDAINELISFRNRATHRDVHLCYNAEGLLEAKIIASQQRLYIYNTDGDLINSLIKTQHLASTYLAKAERVIINSDNSHLSSQQYLISGLLGTNYMQLNAESEISQQFNYQSFGELEDFARGNAKQNITSFDALPILYDGQYQDITSDLIYLHARFYSPKLMQFIQRDNYPLLNRYNYANDNPVNNTDPSGHMSLGLMNITTGLGLALSTSLAVALSPEFSSVAAFSFMVGGIAPAGLDMTLDFLHHRYLSGASNALLMLSGVVGSISAQPEMMLPSVRRLASDGLKADSEEELAALNLKNRYQTLSSTVSNILAGAAAGLAKPYMSDHSGGIYSSAAISATMGFASGQFYGFLSAKLGKSENAYINLLIGSGRSGVSGIISASPMLISKQLSGGIETSDYLVQGIPFLFGGVSGVTQNYLRDAYKMPQSTNLALASFFRTGYLNIKPPISNAVSSNTLKQLFSN
ncbi:RHS repeat domain-containing protein [Cysteiniphilum litorale]|uniref:RHS repeat domain-containing protein n=1 Tax=Cysteiniphilum litorale TaxID=2056700 RepID=UPI003F880BD6